MSATRRLRTLVVTGMLVAAAACSQPFPEVVGDVSLEMNPTGRVPLAGLLTFTTDQPARATLTIGDGESSTTVTPKEEFGTEHQLMVLGLRAGRTNTVQIRLESENGDVSQPSVLTIEAPPLPDDFPPITVSLSRPALMEPGYTFMPINSGAEGSSGYLVVIDGTGEVVWWKEREFADVIRLRNGNLLIYYDGDRHKMAEIDMLGNVIRRWHAARVRSKQPEDSIAIDIDSIHHEVLELPSGNFMTLSTELREFADYPTSITDPDAPRQSQMVVGDVIVEFQKGGTIVRQWHLLDLLDPYRLGYNSLSTGFYAEVYAEALDTPPLDVSHGNSLDYLEESDSVILSFRHLDAVARLNLGANRVEWILGDPTGWREPWSNLVFEPAGPIEWFYGQHSADMTPSGTIILYDNGAWGRAQPPNPQQTSESFYSRAVEFELDAVEGTARQIWTFGDLEEDRFWAPAGGDVDWQPQTGNVIVSGIQLVEPDGRIEPQGSNQRRPRVLVTEVTHTDPPEKVWEITIDDPAQAWSLYRSVRMPSLYP